MALKIAPIMPPRDKAAIEAAVTRMFKLMQELSVKTDPDGFVRSWMGDNTRVVMAEEDGVPKGIATMVFGRRFYDERFTASVLFAAGPARNEILHYMKDMAAVLGAEVFIYETEDGDTLVGEDGNVRFVRL